MTVDVDVIVAEPLERIAGLLRVGDDCFGGFDEEITERRLVGVGREPADLDPIETRRLSSQGGEESSETPLSVYGPRLLWRSPIASCNVDDCGSPAASSSVATFFYPIDRFDDLEAFFESGVGVAADFQSEDTPFSNRNICVDVSNGDGVGTVGLGEANVDNEDVGYDLFWSPTRAEE